jgi:hypothetical protein
MDWSKVNASAPSIGLEILSCCHCTRKISKDAADASGADTVSATFRETLIFADSRDISTRKLQAKRPSLSNKYKVMEGVDGSDACWRRLVALGELAPINGSFSAS